MPTKSTGRHAAARELVERLPLGPTVKDTCDWLSRSPALEEVAASLRSLRLAHRELT